MAPNSRIFLIELTLEKKKAAAKKRNFMILYLIYYMYISEIKSSPSKAKIIRSASDTKIPPLITVSKSKPRFVQNEEKPPEVSRALVLENSLVESEIIVEREENKTFLDDFSDENQFIEMEKYSHYGGSEESIKGSAKESLKESRQKSQKSIEKSGIIELFEEIALKKGGKPQLLKKTCPQLLFTVLSNPEKLKTYIKYLHNIQLENRLKNSKISAHLDVLICLLTKLASNHIEVSLSSNDENSFNMTFSTPEERKSEQEGMLKMKELKEQISYKDEEINHIKQRYDEVIHDYALSFANLRPQQAENERNNQYIYEDDNEGQRIDFRASKSITFEGMNKASRQGSLEIQ